MDEILSAVCSGAEIKIPQYDDAHPITEANKSLISLRNYTIRLICQDCDFVLEKINDLPVPKEHAGESFGYHNLQYCREMLRKVGSEVDQMNKKYHLDEMYLEE